MWGVREGRREWKRRRERWGGREEKGREGYGRDGKEGQVERGGNIGLVHEQKLDKTKV